MKKLILMLMMAASAVGLAAEVTVGVTNVVSRQPTLADLKKIDGFGEAKAEKYGARLLACGESVEVRAEAQSRGEEPKGEAVDGRARTPCEPFAEEGSLL